MVHEASKFHIILWFTFGFAGFSLTLSKFLKISKTFCSICGLLSFSSSDAVEYLLIKLFLIDNVAIGVSFLNVVSTETFLLTTFNDATLTPFVNILDENLASFEAIFIFVSCLAKI
jgi:hypothetical protein